MAKRVGTTAASTAKKSKPVSTSVPGLDEAEFASFVRRMQARFEANFIAHGGRHLFTTTAGDDNSLFEIFLDYLPGHRQYHTCHCCRHFITRYGSLACLAGGKLTPAVWNVADAPPFYKDAVKAMDAYVRKAAVTGLFVSAERHYGQRQTGDWTHFALQAPGALQFSHALLTPGQYAAEKYQDYVTVSRALGDFSELVVSEAVRVLEADALYRSEKVLGQATWLRDLHVARSSRAGKARNNIVWEAVAAAPAGFCHPRSSMIGSLLEDISAGLGFADVSARFKAKMHPLQYQRPQAAPSAGNIAQAEKVFERLGLALSLERRYARIDEVEAIWRPAAAKAAKTGSGVFGHLQAKDSASQVGLQLPSQTMTWERFARLVLGTAEQIEFSVPASGNFAAMTTALHADAPPILQWDLEEQRNPVSFYLYQGGSQAHRWGLSVYRYQPVTAVVQLPHQWGSSVARYPHMRNGVMLLLEGAKDSQYGSIGNCLFPEILKSELHSVRSTIEQYSKSAKLAGYEDSSACGMLLDGGGNFNAQLRVLVGGNWSTYKIDRFEQEPSMTQELPQLIRPAILAELRRIGKSRYWLAKQVGMTPSDVNRALSEGYDMRNSTSERMMHVLGLKIS